MGKSVVVRDANFEDHSFNRRRSALVFALLVFGSFFGKLERIEKPAEKDGARCRFRTYDPYRVKVMLYH